MDMKSILLAVFGLISVPTASASAADLIKSRTDFLSGAQDVVNRSFDDVTDTISFNGTSARYRDITLSTSKLGEALNNGNQISPSASYAPTYNINGTVFAEFDVAQGGTAAISFDNVYSAVGFNIRGLGNLRSTTVSFLDATGSTIAAYPFFSPVPDGDGYFGFIGVRSDSGIKSIQFLYNDQYVNDYFGLDDLVTVGAIPEPATWAMLLVGFAMVSAMARRQRKVCVSVA